MAYAMNRTANPYLSATGHPDVRQAGSPLAAAAWYLLLGLSFLGVVNHVLGVATFAADGDERMMFTLFAAVDLYAAAVLLTAYRRSEPWAWALTWAHSAAYALVFVFTGPGIGSVYLIVAGLSALAQLAGLPAIRRHSSRYQN